MIYLRYEREERSGAGVTRCCSIRR